ncbi:glyceraldehyde-3-phosphate dehydrogenase [Liquorilactobacillus ghanensis DSM 18630]|uniref:Glyceraldehyde-3-phosphate dehydrogenase n=1 Tax=Liquorilactobacillus ghanensis DSM 18630 TaxID=1423750 RepID=A0A0R1VR36_9LACO|nr:type I glyceraldehyde-3-phosphate dehydrogenase [Liquorilactobacillus ghanensis]KRM08222.1 glyceraldehyde-3-phosphate dehydrogenase [Liquorilactobacillus ghanensis DSM 18630]
MTVKVAINGFGRIGRLAFRRIQEVEGIEVTAINDLTDVKMLANLLKFDTTQGKFNGSVYEKENKLVVNDQVVDIFSNPDPSKLPWGKLGIDIVLECTGFFTSKEKAKSHIEAGAKKVLISAFAGNNVPTIVFNTNHDILNGDENIISGASCTTNSLAPMAQVLNNNFGIIEGLMTTIHAYTGDQMTLDGPHRKGDYRRARAAAENIVPTSTGAAKAIGQVIPELSGKLDGVSQRVPVKAGSLTELYTVLEKNTSVEEVNHAMQLAANESFGYNTDPIVSTDVIGMTYGSLFDETQTRIMEVNGKQLVKTVAWYDNEMSYTSQLVRTLKYFAQV